MKVALTAFEARFMARSYSSIVKASGWRAGSSAPTATGAATNSPAEDEPTTGGVVVPPKGTPLSPCAPASMNTARSSSLARPTTARSRCCEVKTAAALPLVPKASKVGRVTSRSRSWDPSSSGSTSTTRTGLKFPARSTRSATVTSPSPKRACTGLPGSARSSSASVRVAIPVIAS